jgi:hypothetical protein
MTINIGGDASGQVAIGNGVHQTMQAPTPAGPADGKQVVLFLAANPLDTERLRLDEEARSISRRLQEGDYRDRFDFRPHLAVRATDLSEALLRHSPAVVHFSGHGSPDGRIILQNEQGQSFEPPATAIADLFRIFKGTVRCVVLNACHSESLAKAIAQNIDCVVGTKQAITDDDAVSFAAGFYRALSFGKSIGTAFDIGRNEIKLSGSAGSAVPSLVTRPGMDAGVASVISDQLDTDAVPLAAGSGVLFDEGHGQAMWSGVPAPVVTGGFRRAAEVAASFGPVQPLRGGMLTPQVLNAGKCLVLSTAPHGRARLNESELEALRGFVEGGGGVVVLGNYAGEWHHESNLNEFLAPFGLAFNADVLAPTGTAPERAFGATNWAPTSSDLRIEAVPSTTEYSQRNRRDELTALLDGVNEVHTVSPCSLSVDQAMAIPLLESTAQVFRPIPRTPQLPQIREYVPEGAGPVVVAAASTIGKVVAVGTWKTFLDDFLYDDRSDNERFLANVFSWLT